MKFKTILFALILAASSAFADRATDLYNPRIWGQVTLGTWATPTAPTGTATTGGAYTNAGITNTFSYRYVGTNALGRTQYSPTCTVTLAESTNLSAVLLSWSRYDGIQNYWIERSTNAGATWPVYQIVNGGLTQLLDFASSQWSNGTMGLSVIPATSVPWDTTALSNAVIDLNAATGSLNSTAASLVAATNALDVRLGTVESTTLTGYVAIAASTNWLAVSSRNLQGCVTNIPSGGASASVSTTFTTNQQSTAWLTKLQNKGLVTTTTTIDPMLGAFAKLIYTNAAITNTLSPVPFADHTAIVTVQLQRNSSENGTPTVIYWSTNVAFPGGWSTNWPLSTTTGAVDIFQFQWDGLRYNFLNGRWDVK